MARSPQQVIAEMLPQIFKQPTASKEAVDAALLAVLHGVQNMGPRVVAAIEASSIREARGTPRERSINQIGRLLFLELLYQHILILKKAPTGRFFKVGIGEVGPSNFVLGHVRQTYVAAREIESNLRRLGAIDGIDSAIYSALSVHIQRFTTASYDAAMPEGNSPKNYGHDIGPFLADAENGVVRRILEKMVRRYVRGTDFFDLSRALMDLVGELALNNMKSMLRVRELRELYDRDEKGEPVTAYYRALYTQIRNSS